MRTSHRRWWALLGVSAVLAAIFVATRVLPALFQEGLGEAGERSLLVIEFSGTDEGLSVLGALHFRKGKFIGKEELVARNQRFFGHWGTNWPPVDDRYLIMPHGGVIDLVKKTILHSEEDGTILGVEDRKVMYRVNNSRRECGVFALDLISREVRKLEPAGKWGLPGTLSPDGACSAEATPNGEVILHRPNGGRTVLAEGLRIDHSPLSSHLGNDVPILWLDCHSILTQRANGELILVKTDGTQHPVVESPSWESIGRPKLYRDRLGQIVYFDCTIDIDNKTFATYERVPLGHDFEVDNTLMDPTTNKRNLFLHYRYCGKDIGARWSTAWEGDNLTTSGYLATLRWQNHGYSSRKGVSVWSTTKGWTTIEETERVSRLVGWIESAKLQQE